MTWLFLRFYLGVVTILIIAWAIQGYVFRTRSESQNIRTVEEALGGGAKLARDRLAAAPPERRRETLNAINATFDYPVHLQAFESLPDFPNLQTRLLQGDTVLHRDTIIVAIPEQQQALVFGPLPKFVGPRTSDLVIGFGSIFLLAAIAIAILLRPVVSQLRAVEKTALAISGGDLSARIDHRKAVGRLPLADAFNAMAGRTETLLRSQRELLQAVSHELRTPLARIRFAADLIETAKTDQERQQRLESVDKATQQLDDLVSELLTYVRLESESSRGSEELIDIHELFDDLIQIDGPLYPQIQFAIASDSQPIQMKSERTSLSRAIGNLISNAAKYGHSQVELSGRLSGSNLQIFVDDDGRGIAEAERERIFEPFVILENGRDSTLIRQGTGLGLALVRRIVTGKGGDVSIETSPLGGSRFIIELPATGSYASSESITPLESAK